MKQITEFLGKPVLSLYEGNIEGYVKNVIFDKTFKKMKYIIIFEDNEYQDEKMLEATKVFNFGENAITIKNNTCLQLKKEEVLELQNHINCKVFTPLGQYLGIIGDIEINENNFSIENVVLTNGQKLKPDQFFSFGQDVFFLQDLKKPIKMFSIKKRNEIILNNTKPLNTVTIQPLNNQQANLTENQTTTNHETTSNQTKKQHTFNNSSLPKRVLSNNNDFLIGRKTTKTIYSSNNEIIVKKNMLITDKTIQQAIMFNKLRELAIYSI